MPARRIRTPLSLGEEIRARRKAAGLTLTEAAELIGVSRRLLVELENGKRRVAVHTLFDILAALGLEMSVRERSRGGAGSA